MLNNGTTPAATNRRPVPEARWRRQWLLWGLPALGCLFALNHAAGWRRRRAAPPPPPPTIVVRAEGGLFSGHNTIGIDEGASGDGGALLLRFATLAQWALDPKVPLPCPKPVQDLKGRQVDCIGFMYPLESGATIKTFCLLRTTQTCCYGPKPQFNQYLLVELPKPVRFERLAPVIVHGRFFPDPQPKQGFIYRLEGESVTPIRDEAPDADPAAVARRLDLPLFDFTPLAALANATATALPADLRRMEGQRVVLAGYLLDRTSGDPPQVLVGRNWWDGVSQGKPPTVYTAVLVTLTDQGQLPPLWTEKGVFTGVLHLETEKQAWSQHGIVRLTAATRAGTAARATADRSGRGPYLPAWQEAVLLAVFLGAARRWRRGPAAAAPTPSTEGDRS